MKRSFHGSVQPAVLVAMRCSRCIFWGGGGEGSHDSCAGCQVNAMMQTAGRAWSGMNVPNLGGQPAQGWTGMSGSMASRLLWGHLDHEVPLEVILKALQLQLQDWREGVKCHSLPRILQSHHQYYSYRFLSFSAGVNFADDLVDEAVMKSHRLDSRNSIHTSAEIEVACNDRMFSPNKIADYEGHLTPIVDPCRPH